MNYQRLIALRSMKSRDTRPPEFTLVGRLTGQNVTIPDNQTYERYKMRRKVEILQYNDVGGQNATKKQSFSRMSQLKGSSQVSQHSIQNLTIPCPTVSVLLPPTFSGIRDPDFPGYQLDPSIRFRLFL